MSALKGLPRNALFVLSRSELVHLAAANLPRVPPATALDVITELHWLDAARTGRLMQPALLESLATHILLADGDLAVAPTQPRRPSTLQHSF